MRTYGKGNAWVLEIKCYRVLMTELVIDRDAAPKIQYLSAQQERIAIMGRM